MKLSREWLNDYVDCLDLSPQAFNDLITTKVAEVDAVHSLGAPLRTGVICHVVSVSDHPERKTLKVATIDIGGAPVQVVCGAPNCRAGMNTVYLPPGSTAISADGVIAVEKRAIGGVESSGMLASEYELELSGDHSGIIEIAADVKPGTAATAHFGDGDVVLEIDNKSLTHRPDLWSHLGFARELAALLQRPMKMLPDMWADSTNEGRAALAELKQGKANIEIQVDADTKCRRFLGIEIANLTPSPSPLWIRRRLFAVGAGVRNLLVDLSNYVMHDVGQPTHTYDADKLTGKTLHVRLAKEGEGCKSLDGVDRVLTAGDVVVADERGPQCVGGIIGGDSSAISDSTKRIILEAANWDPVLVRQTAKRQGVRTDASNRFEKNQSPYLCPVGVQRFIELLKRCDSKIEVGGALVDTFPIVPSEVKVPVDGDYIRTRLGHPISNGEIGQILTNLGFVFDSSKREVSVPYYRATRDISIAEDLIEEVGRILGYAEIPEAAPKFPATVTPFEKIRSFENSIQDLLRGVGFSAVYAYSIVGSRRMQQLGYDVSRAVYLENPLDVDEDSLRVSLVPGMIRLIEENARHENQVALFELGRSYELWRDPGTNRETPPAHERRLLCLGYMSGLDEQNYSQISQPATTAGGDFYAVAASVSRIVRLVTGARFEILPNTGAGTGASSDDPFALRSWMHPHRQGRIVVDGKSIGVIAEVHPAMTDAKSRSVLAEIDLGELLALEGVRDYREVSRYPDSFFELSIVMPERKPYRELEQFLRSHIEQSNLRRLDVVAHYRGAPLKEDEKSVSVKFFLGRDDRTLAREELQSIQESLIAAVRKGGFRLSGEAAA